MKTPTTYNPEITDQLIYTMVQTIDQPDGFIELRNKATPRSRGKQWCTELFVGTQALCTINGESTPENMQGVFSFLKKRAHDKVKDMQHLALKLKEWEGIAVDPVFEFSKEMIWKVLCNLYNCARIIRPDNMPNEWRSLPMNAEEIRVAIHNSKWEHDSGSDWVHQNLDLFRHRTLCVRLEADADEYFTYRLSGLYAYDMANGYEQEPLAEQLVAMARRNLIVQVP